MPTARFGRAPGGCSSWEGAVALLTRFNWWEYYTDFLYDPDWTTSRSRRLRDLETFALTYLSGAERHREQFETGDEEAIFEFARESMPLLAPWVIAQLSRWATSRDPKDKTKMQRLLNAFGDARGQARPTEIFSLIRRDKEIFAAVIDEHCVKGQSVEVSCAQVGERFQLGEDAIKGIYQDYLKFAGRWRDATGRSLDSSGEWQEFITTVLMPLDPAEVWARAQEKLDLESTAFVLFHYIRRDMRNRRVNFGDLTEPPARASE